ncbi:MAG: hypothetical protein KME55_40400 [Nostoc indistinguendum CM1-VF10]|jgi:DMATS type aromatic prenyltransferase|nr:hypothetical protein [Nostoc indistinguendum CM1-VF10]
MTEHNTMQTFKTFGAAKLSSLCNALNLRTETTLALQLLDIVIARWGDHTIGRVPLWNSDITDDHTPFEFSLAFDGKQPELRVLIEAQGNPTTLMSSWTAALDVNERLNWEFGVSLERFTRVKDLFEPHDPQAKFSLWHSFCLKPGAVPKFKVYLNPQAHGSHLASSLVKEALERLGFSRAWDFLSKVALCRREKDQLIYFSLDLDKSLMARVKVYVAHKDATANDVEEVLAGAPEYIEGSGSMFCREMAKGERLFDARPLITCFAFTADNDAQPFSATLHLPIRCYADNDYTVMQRICHFLTPEDKKLYKQAVMMFAGRPLETGVGLQTYASFKRQGGRQITTVYLSPEAYDVMAPDTPTGKVLVQI